MKTCQHVILITVLVASFPSSAAHAQPTNRTAAKAKAGFSPGSRSERDSKRPDAVASPAETRASQPTRPDRSENSARPDVVKQLLEDFKQAQTRFLEEQKQLRQRLKDATDDNRARIRSEIQAKRQTFLDQQREAREEIHRRLTDIKDKLKDHREVLDAAKEEAKDKGRKGGGD